jgi:alpha/beta superfamily hydrolase
MMQALSHIRSVEDLHGPAGRLEAVLNTGRLDASYAALICHPHPLGGGTLHNKVVYHTMKAFTSVGLPVLRFNFRGVGLSEGSHDHGRGEIDDARAALDWLDEHLQLPILLAGFSFGSFVGMRAGCGDGRVKGLIGLGIPSLADGRTYSFEFLEDCTQPKLFVCGAEDQFGPRAAVEPMLQRAAAPKRMVWIEGAEHFFQGTPSSPGAKLNQMQAQILTWLHKSFGLGSQ